MLFSLSFHFTQSTTYFNKLSGENKREENTHARHFINDKPPVSRPSVIIFFIVVPYRTAVTTAYHLDDTVTFPRIAYSLRLINCHGKCVLMHLYRNTSGCFVFRCVGFYVLKPWNLLHYVNTLEWSSLTIRVGQRKPWPGPVSGSAPWRESYEWYSTSN